MSVVPCPPPVPAWFSSGPSREGGLHAHSEAPDAVPGEFWGVLGSSLMSASGGRTEGQTAQLGGETAQRRAGLSQEGRLSSFSMSRGGQREIEVDPGARSQG